MVLFVPIVISSTRTACYCCQNARAKAEHKKLTKNFSFQRCFTLKHNIGVLSSPYTLSYPTSTSLIDVYLCMWYKPRIYTLDHTTCLLCPPPLPLLISEAVKNCQDISCWRKLGGGDVWSCHKSEMFVTCGNARAHLFPNSCVAKTLKFNFQLFLCIFWCAPPHSKQFQRLPLT